MPGDDEKQSIAAAREGHSPAFADLINRYSGPLLRFVSTIVGDEHDAEDVVQLAFLNAYRNLDQFDSDRGEFSTWLYRIARNGALNHVRSRRRSKVEFGTPVPESCESTDPAARAIRQEQFGLLDRALAALPANQRTAWTLSEIESLSQAQIAAIEGIPEGTVKSRVSRANAFLRDAVAQQPNTDSIGVER